MVLNGFGWGKPKLIIDVTFSFNIILHVRQLCRVILGPFLHLIDWFGRSMLMLDLIVLFYFKPKDNETSHTVT